MKKLFLTLAAVAAVTNGFAQGTVNFNNNVPGTVVTRVYMPDNSGAQNSRTGNTATQTPPGTQVYTSALVTGSGFTAQIWSAPGAGQPESALIGYTTSTFRTGAAAGVFVGVIATLGNVLPDAAAATLQVRVFETQYGTWAAAEAAYQTTLDVIIGKSELFTVNNIGGVINTTPPLLTGLTSFNTYTFIPEPSSLTLAGLGAAAMLWLRRDSAKR